MAASTRIDVGAPRFHDSSSWLEWFIEHCCSARAGGFTPSDFPLARLSQGELDTLSGLLGEE